MRDFTISIYEELLKSLKNAGYAFQTFEQYLTQPNGRAVILRHDVDDRKLHSLEFAKIQHNMGVKGVYYFRMVPESFDAGVIREIYSLGHEVGYHYEDMDFADGDPHKAVRLFEKHLNRLREIVPVKTICMHGSPKSAYDNKDVWKYYDYKSYGIVGEPYFDLDFTKIFYLTDTGRRWDGHKVSVRDKVANHFGLSFRSTQDIIEAVNRREFPDQIMINFHPQRWTDDLLLWFTEKQKQNAKNFVKYWLIKLREPKSLPVQKTA